MSAYIVDNSTINRIVAGLIQAEQSSWNSPYCKSYDCELAIDQNTAEQFAISLRAMNENAVSQLYTMDALDELPGPQESGKLAPFRYMTIIPPSPVQFVKSLDCFIYQCSEGDVPDTSPLYKALYAYRGTLCHHIVSSGDAYETANWD